MEEKVMRKVVIEIGEDNRILRGQIYEIEEGEEKVLDMELPEILQYIYDFCDGVAIMIKHEDRLEEQNRKYMAERDFEFREFRRAVIAEALEQLGQDPLTIMKLVILSPVITIADWLENVVLPNKVKHRFYVAVYKFVLRFLFGKENASRIEGLIEEGRKKIYELS